VTRRAAAAAVSVVVALAAFGAIVAGSLLGALAGAPPVRAATTTAQTAPGGTSTATTALAATTLTTPASTAATTALAATTPTTPASTAATTALAATTLTTPASTAVATSAAHDTTPPPPPLGVRAAALIEESSDQQLFGENANAELAIASTTKLMTALITLEHTRLNRVFADPDYPLSSEDSQIGLEPGERMSVHDLLLAMLLPSADDAAIDLAYNVGHGSISRFVGMMNARARQLGLTHTHYASPSGLDTPGNYSSANDLVNLARYDLQHEPFFRFAVRQTHAVLRTGNHVRFVTNLNGLLRFPWINGVKTGHTLDAGYVLVASGTQGGMTLVDAVLGTSSEAARDSNALALLQWGFANFGVRTPVRAGRVLARPVITGIAPGAPGAHARLIAASTYTHVFPRSASVTLRVHAPADLTGPLPAQSAVGWVSVVENHRVVTRIPLLLVSAVPAVKKSHPVASAVVVSVTLSGLLVAVGAAIGLTMFWREWTRGTRGGRPRSTKPR
jgi:D-alanyl-D-alanine carboxypeptidase (penicillin-binding protein 5/6)